MPHLPQSGPILSLVGSATTVYAQWQTGWFQEASGTGRWAATSLALAGHPLTLLSSTPDGRGLLAQSTTEVVRSSDEGKTWQSAPPLPQQGQATRAVDALFVTTDGTWVVQIAFTGSIGESGGFAAIFVVAPHATTWTQWWQVPVSGGGFYIDYWKEQASAVTVDTAGHPVVVWATARYNSRSDGPWVLQASLTGSPP